MCNQSRKTKLVIKSTLLNYKKGWSVLSWFDKKEKIIQIYNKKNTKNI